jgi:hypothetical protein
MLSFSRDVYSTCHAHMIPAVSKNFFVPYVARMQNALSACQRIASTKVLVRAPAACGFNNVYHKKM